MNHLGRRDFVCPRDDCKRAFGYKHLLQRHLARLHAGSSEDSDSNNDIQDRQPTSAPARLGIDDITGKNYSVRSKQMMTMAKVLCCPHPDLRGLITEARPLAGGSKRCEYVFSRAYDFRRHLQSEHSIVIEKDIVDRWVQMAKKAKIPS